MRSFSLDVFNHREEDSSWCKYLSGENMEIRPKRAALGHVQNEHTEKEHRERNRAESLQNCQSSDAHTFTFNRMTMLFCIAVCLKKGLKALKQH